MIIVILKDLKMKENKVISDHKKMAEEKQQKSNTGFRRTSQNYLSIICASVAF